MNKELYNQIIQETTSGQHTHPGTDFGNGYNKGYDSGYKIAGEKYAEKWQEEKELRERYEKALNWVKQYALNCQNNGTIPTPLVIYSAIEKALTPKQTTDDTVNG